MSITFGVAPGLAILVLGVLSLKVWRSGKSSLPFILAQAALAAAVAWKNSQAYITTKKLLPWGFYVALRYYPNSSPVSNFQEFIASSSALLTISYFTSTAMICFYSYVLLAGGNPPPKKAATT
ncbi:hypothetical protein PR202_gb17131 [Eleusine coracana subsp. coracana]|uniref:Uncharacterized protein n=1 Tax=Eleusine coracana subsp. coracana TaxID=191504 RepID=A0AAV5F261_ELECO|nr:hypothetical protein PR202_gb17131 [Eleusine coracana subsp. coracana]